MVASSEPRMSAIPCGRGHRYFTRALHDRLYTTRRWRNVVESPFYGGGCQDTLPHPPDVSHLASGVRPHCSPDLAHRLLMQEHTRGSRAIPGAPWSMVMGSSFSSGIPGDIAAAPFSTPEWEPSFYQGLLRPLLCSALRGGITYQWGLRIGCPGPEDSWMLTP